MRSLKVAAAFLAGLVVGGYVAATSRALGAKLAELEAGPAGTSAAPSVADMIAAHRAGPTAADE